MNSPRSKHETLHRGLQEIINHQLSAVTFVQDYVQLHFDGPMLTAITQPSIETGAEVIYWNQLGYRDKLCSLITHKVVSAGIHPEEGLYMSFNNGDLVRISLRDEDYRGPEAVQFDSSAGTWVA